MLRRLLGNAAISLIGQAVTWTSTLLLTFAYGTFLGDAKYGELYFAITFVLLLGIPAGPESGYDIQITRGVAREPEEGARYAANVAAIKAVTWAGIYALALLLSWVCGFGVEVSVLVGICGLGHLTTTLAATLASVQYAYERAIYPVVGAIFEKGLSMVAGLIVLSLGGGVWGMALVLLTGSLVSGIWQGFWFFRLVRGRFTLDLGLMRQLVRANVPFLLYGVIGTLYFRVDVVILSAMTNDRVVGWYGAGYRLFDTLNFLPGMMMTLLYPIFSKLSLSDEKGLRLAAEKAVNFALLTGMPIATALIVAAPAIIRFLYRRPEFDHGIPAMQALAPGLVCLYVNMALGIIFLNTKQDGKMPARALIALIFNLGLNLVLIPLYAHVGAAITTSLTELFLVFISIYLVPRHLRPAGSIVVAGRAFCASVLMGLVMSWLPQLGIGVLPIGALVYVGIALWIGAVDRADLAALRDAIRVKVGARAARQPQPQMAAAELSTATLAEAPEQLAYSSVG